MEKLYKPEHFNATDHINLREYFKKYTEQLFKEQKSHENVDTRILSFLKEDEFTYENLIELNLTCNVENLTVPGEQMLLNINHIKGIKAAASLHHPGEIDENSLTLHTVRKVYERKKDNNERMLFRELRDRTLHIKENRPEGIGDPNLRPGEDIVIRIRFFRPFSYNYSHPCSEDAFKFDHEIMLLGSNTLAELRDKIKCSSDLSVLSEISNNPSDISNSVSAKKVYPSGFIFIDGVFYNDFRDSNSIDYSEVIRKWAQSKEIGSFQTADMDKTQIISLNPRFGYPYVYQHQGRCEHIFIFSHAKILSTTDPMHLNCYPYYSDVGGGKVVFCFICGMSLPIWLVVDCDRLPQCNTPLCNDCFKSYCYTDGKKVGKFKAYPYVTRSAMF